MPLVEITSRIIGITEPRIFNAGERKKVDYYQLVMVDREKRRITVFFPVDSLGLNSEERSKVFFFNEKSNKWMKHRMVTPKRLFGTVVKVKGDLRLQDNGFYMNKVEYLKILKTKGSSPAKKL